MIESFWRTDTPFHPPVHEARESGRLDVGEGHTIWWEETGPETGCPVLVLHGGPGGSIKPDYRRLLDPRRHRGVYFDQRGCGRSTPAGSIEANDTFRLVSDIERLRQHRGISRWVVVGGSWGSTLALAYAQSHPEVVSGLVVSGVLLARPSDLDWWWNGVRQVFPDVVDARNAILTPEERTDARSAILSRILDQDGETRREASAALMYSELQTLDLAPTPAPSITSEIAESVVTYARVFAHYERNGYFIEDGRLLRDAARLKNVPGYIIAGRSDMCTPPAGAYDLHQAWPSSRLQIVAGAGHRWTDATLGLALVPAIAEIVAQAERE